MSTGPASQEKVCVEHKTINGVLTPITRKGEPCVGQHHDACPLKKRK